MRESTKTEGGAFKPPPPPPPDRVGLRLQSQNILLYLLLKYPLTIWNIANVHVLKHNSVYNYLKRETIAVQ